MEDGEDYLFRVVLHGGMIPATALIDGSVDLEFVALCNEAIDVEIENSIRREKAGK